MNPLSRTSSRSAFTLVELLVVIGIIVVLMSLLLTAVPAVKDAQKKLDARQTCTQIVAAVNAYYTDYAKFPPVVSATEAAANPPNSQKDTVVGDEAMNATVANNALFNTLRNVPKGVNENYSLNPRRVVFYEGKAAVVASGNKARGGFFDRTADGAAPPEAQAGSLYDPWGKQFGIVLDTNSDERINLDGFYSDFTGDDPSTGKAPRKRAGAFSTGKDEALGKNGDRTFRKGSEASDDVVSWE